MVDEELKIELGKQGVFVTTIEELYNWGRRSSIWPMQFGLACCAIEMIATTMARYDLARFGGRGVPAVAAAGRPDDHLRHGDQEDGAAGGAALQPDGRAEVRDRHGRLRHLWRAVQAGLQRAEGDRPVHSGGCAHSGMPAAARGADSGLHDAAKEDRRAAA